MFYGAVTELCGVTYALVPARTSLLDVTLFDNSFNTFPQSWVNTEHMQENIEHCQDGFLSAGRGCRLSVLFPFHMETPLATFRAESVQVAVSYGNIWRDYGGRTAEGLVENSVSTSWNKGCRYLRRQWTSQPLAMTEWSQRAPSPGLGAGSLNSSSDAGGSSLLLLCLGTGVYINLGLCYNL